MLIPSDEKMKGVGRIYEVYIGKRIWALKLINWFSELEIFLKDRTEL